MSRLLLRCRTERRMEIFKDSSCLLTSSGMNVQVDVPATITTSFEFIDSHFHLDLILQKIQTPTGDYHSFDDLQQLVVSNFTKNELLFGIANYVFPHHWRQWEKQVDNSPKIKVTFGVHPHIAARGISHRQKQELAKYILSDQCVAVGETGLDYTTSCECVREGIHCPSEKDCKERIRANQEEGFLFQLQLATKLDLPAVIHCRDK
ncbi:tatD [Mytilus coruscus]|uniref:TatD n=1 Tax=Mytilus coruscus TaxID=42192 RepID=A0A6J8D0Q4_MYTCO|nr:tatD [Mytilus coruscus]